jgi:hypothetical protein
MSVALAPVPSLPRLVVIAHDDPGTADSLRHAVESAAGWQVLMADPSPAGLTAALASGPSVALVGCATLANLPAGWRAPIVAIGDDDRPADVRAALAAGARSLLAWPDGVADLPGELARLAALDQPSAAGGPSGLVVAARGVQGGAGTTTIAVHLAAAWARWGPAPVLLLDLAGGLAFRLDLAAAPTWATLVPTSGTAVASSGPEGGVLARSSDLDGRIARRPGAEDMDALDTTALAAGAQDAGALDPGARSHGHPGRTSLGRAIPRTTSRRGRPPGHLGPAVGRSFGPAACRLRERPTRSLEHRMTVRALRCTALRIQLLAAEAAELRAELERLVAAIAPWLLELPGVGPISAAQVVVSWSHAGRLHSEAAFAALAGANPIPASSGQVTRHRLNRSGDRQLNRALHTIVVARLRDDPDTRAYATRRQADGKSARDIRRCLKRAVARQLFKLLERCDRSTVQLLRIG